MRLVRAESPAGRADFMGYCNQRKVTKDELFEIIEQGLKERRLASKVAA
ncbi:hypothetical protein GCM10011348_33250 [Marinobacterium nitratireducens]|uniref:Uncharacterized protein n=1 Tax=Marinobacterium nitratireducens TaxID=518897 RepID=A0A917ZK60_9GAMM|nr:hypothetical protein [Marinobacterium nitratireducens]GGO85214.1 hypothetical protein GCM10011348_33250 [Marinobacterium nitratireducens]